MASSTSLKELSKAIAAFIPNPTLPLPDHLTEVIAAYLERHKKYDDAASDRLQEDLFSIFNKHVKSKPPTYAAWFGILRRLLPVLHTQERLLQWLDACQGFITEAPHDKGMITETVAGLLDLVMLAESYQDTADNEATVNPIIQRLFAIWMDRVYPASIECDSNAQHNERIIRDALIQFGRKRPKAFYASLDSYFIKKDYRKAALRFFCEYVQSRPPHLHQILDSTLFSHLLICLQQDTSTTAVSAALIALVMLLPHMPSSIVPHLPTLFNIYARILFLNRERSVTADQSSLPIEVNKQWEVCTYDPEVEDANVAALGNYFTIIYGLYPINFMDYIRKPQRYLRHANIENADDVEVQPTEIRHQSERFRRCHLLHPNFYTLTIESERTDFGRWIKSEAAEVAAECISLCITSDDFADTEANPEPVPVSERSNAVEEPEKDDADGADEALLSTSLRKNSQETWGLIRSPSEESLSSRKDSLTLKGQDTGRSRSSQRNSTDDRVLDSVVNSPTLSANLAASASYTRLQDMIQSNKAVKSGLAQSLTNNDSVPSLALSHSDDKAAGLVMNTSKPTETSSGIDTNARVSQLQRQILLLQNDLTFERYQKQQHMAHIGDLRRRLVSEAASEAETQDLILNYRRLKLRYDMAKEDEIQIRKDSEKSRTMAKKWEADLSQKIKIIRDESKEKQAELAAIRGELEEGRQEIEKLRKMVCDAEVNDMRRKQHEQSNEMHIGEVDRLKAEISRLTLAEREAQGREQTAKEAAVLASEAEGRAEGLKLELAAQKQEVQKTRSISYSQITSLQAQLTEALKACDSQATHVPAEVEKMLAASRAKQQDMKKKHEILLRKYTSLQSSLLDVQSGNVPDQRMADIAGSPDSADLSPQISPHFIPRARTQRILSETELSDASSQGPSRPLDSMIGSSHLTGSPEPAPASGGSPEAQARYFGRGGFQNRSRAKDIKDKDKPRDASPASTGSAGDKKGKKSGLRGIRGLV